MLTVLQEKLAEVHALAIAATHVTTKVEERVEDGPLRLELRAMRRDAEETRARCLAVEQRLEDDVAEDVLAHANTMRERAFDLAGAWFKAGTGPLAAWTFLAMGEAAEVTAWRALAVMTRGSSTDVADLAAWALPIQERHLQTALDGAVRLAELAEPAGPRWG
jgi:hypothetical protein